MITKGSKIKLINPMGVFDNIGEICEVTNVAEDGVLGSVPVYNRRRFWNRCR